MAVLGLLALVLVRQLGAVRDDLVRGASRDGAWPERARRGRRGGRDRSRSSEGGSSSTQARTARRAARPSAVSWLPVVGRTTDAVERHRWRRRLRRRRRRRSWRCRLADSPRRPGRPRSDERGALPGPVPSARAGGQRGGCADDGRGLAAATRHPDSLLLGPVAPARREAEAELSELNDKIHAASLVLQGLPRFLGAEGPRRYFFGAQNPAELRGTGGLIGAYSILTIDDGRFHFSPFGPIHVAVRARR